MAGNIDADQIKPTDKQGNAGLVQMANGSFTAGHALVYDANGNAVDGGAGGSGVTISFYGTHAARATVSASANPNALYFESDRGNVCYQSHAGVWIYVVGEYVAPISNLPAGLGTNDTGFRFTASDIYVRYVWLGTMWRQITQPVIVAIYDTHANRTSYAVSDYPTSIYFESDRGNVCYQAQGTVFAGASTWGYATGEYVAPMASRPTDLNTTDTGFRFTASDTLTRYQWTGSAWVQISASPGVGTVTSVALTMPAEFSVAGSPITAAGTLAATKANQSANLVYAGPISGGAAAPTFRTLVAADVPTAQAFQAFATSSLTLTTTAADIVGATLTLTYAGVYLITGNFSFNCIGADTGIVFRGQLVLAGAAQTQQCFVAFPTTGGRSGASNQWLLTAATPNQTAKLQALKDTGGSGTSNVVASATSISAIWLHP